MNTTVCVIHNLHFKYIVDAIITYLTQNIPLGESLMGHNNTTILVPFTLTIIQKQLCNYIIFMKVYYLADVI